MNFHDEDNEDEEEAQKSSSMEKTFSGEVLWSLRQRRPGFGLIVLCKSGGESGERAGKSQSTQCSFRRKPKQEGEQGGANEGFEAMPACD